MEHKDEKFTFSSALARARRRAKALDKIRAEDSHRSISKADSAPSRLPIIYANDDFFLTRDEAWTAVRVPNKTRGFLPDRTRRNYFYSAQRFYSRDMPSDKENRGQLLVTNRVVSMDEWESQILDPDSPYNPGQLTAGYQAYVRGARKAVDANDFSEVSVYMLTCIGQRGGTGMRRVVDKMVDLVLAGAGMDDSQPDADEIEFWRPQAQGMRRTIAGSWLAGQHVPRREVEWLTRHQDTPGLPTMDVAPSDEEEWGAGAWRMVSSSYTEEVTLGVRNKKRYRGLRVDGPTGAGTSYVAFLPVAVVPQALRYDSHWLNYAAGLDFPVDICVHFEVMPATRVEKELDKAIETADVQQAESAEVGMTDSATTMQRQSLDQARVDVMMNRSPMVYWQAVMSVYSNDPGDLLDKVEALIQHYGALQIELDCPPLDQRELYYQSFPGAKVTLDDWFHRTDTGFLAAGQPWLDQNVGNAVDVPGDYQGFTLEPDSAGKIRRGVPFFYNLFSVVDAQGKAPTEGVIASPGAGKRLPLTTPILTADGAFKPLGEIKVGDKIWGTHGPTEVSLLSPIKEDAQALRLVFDDGTSQVCDPEHRWTLFGPNQKQPTWDWESTIEDPANRALARLLAYADPQDVTTPQRLCQQVGDSERASDYWEAARQLNPTPMMGEWWTQEMCDLILRARGIDTSQLMVTLTASHVQQAFDEGMRMRLPLPAPIQIEGAADADPAPLLAALRAGTATAADILDALTWTIPARRILINQALNSGPLTGSVDVINAMATVCVATGVGAHHNLDTIRLTGRTWRTLVDIEPAGCVPMRCITVDAPNHLYLAGHHLIPTHNTVSRGLKPVYEDALRGVTQYVWDPKGDFLPLHRRAKDLMLDPDKVHLIDLGDPKVSISLDAFTVAEYDPANQIDDRESSAREVLRLLAREMTGRENPDANTYRGVIDLAVSHVLETSDAAGQPPTMNKVLELLKQWAAGQNLPEIRRQDKADAFIDAAEALARQYSAIQRDSMGRLLFLDPSQGGALGVDEGVLTIFVAMKLKTTGPGEEQSPTTVVGDTIAAMMTDYIRSLLSRLPVKVQKSATFDEWHVIKRTQRADALVDWMRRMGRSRRCAVRQMSQSANDLSASSLACVWVGWATEESEARASCQLLGIEETQSNVEMIMGLSKGEFIFRDGYKRFGRVFVDFWDESILRLFNTEAISKIED